MINVVAFEIGHLNDFYPKDWYEDLNRDMSLNIKDRSKLIFSLLWKEKTLAIFGLTEFRKGVCEIWLLPSIYVDQCKFSFYKCVRGLVHDFIFDDLKYHRVEMAILKGWEKGIKSAKSLGFKEEHVCEAYDTQYRDHLIFTRIKRWQQVQ